MEQANTKSERKPVRWGAILGAVAMLATWVGMFAAWRSARADNDLLQSRIVEMKAAEETLRAEAMARMDKADGAVKEAREASLKGDEELRQALDASAQKGAAVEKDLASAKEEGAVMKQDIDDLYGKFLAPINK